MWHRADRLPCEWNLAAATRAAATAASATGRSPPGHATSQRARGRTLRRPLTPPRPGCPCLPLPRTAAPPQARSRSTSAAIRRVYNVKPKPVVALDGVDLEVEPGEFFGLLGPNGAGKTTLIKILTTLLLPSEGTARIFGFDVERQTKQIRRIMNMVAGGEQSGYGILTVREQLWMFSQFYGLPASDGWNRVDELIDAVGLDEQRPSGSARSRPASARR